MVHARCVFVTSIHPSRTWTSGSFESVRWNACVHRLDLSLSSHPKEFLENEVRTHVNSKGKSTSTGNFLPRREFIIIIIIIIAFKGAIRDVLQYPHSAANCLQHVRSSGPGAIVCKSRATQRALITCKCHVTCHLVRSDSSAIKFARVEIAFIWALFYWLNH